MHACQFKMQRRIFEGGGGTSEVGGRGNKRMPPLLYQLPDIGTDGSGIMESLVS